MVLFLLLVENAVPAALGKVSLLFEDGVYEKWQQHLSVQIALATHFPH